MAAIAINVRTSNGIGLLHLELDCYILCALNTLGDAGRLYAGALHDRQEADPIFMLRIHRPAQASSAPAGNHTKILLELSCILCP